MNHRKKHNLQAITEAFGQFLHAKKMTDKYWEFQCKEIWRETMDDNVKEKVKKMELHNQILRIYIDSALIKTELNYSRSNLLQFFNQRLSQPILLDIQFI